MASTTTVIGAGFSIDPSKARGAAEPDADERPATNEEELATLVIKRLRQGFPAAAMAAAVDLVNSIAALHDLGGGAYL